jgi:PAS domain S-box-containing protein
VSPAHAPDLDRLLGQTADGVCAVDAGGRIVFWNRAAERILGYRPREVMGRPCCTVFVGADAAGNRLCDQSCHVRSLVQRGEPVQHFDMATRTRTGTPVWIDVSLLVIPGGPREVTIIVHLFRDVTAAREIEALVRERLARERPPAAAGAEAAPAVLTRREQEVLGLIASGADTRAIAAALHISPATVRNHVQNLFGKLGVHSRLQAAAHAARNGLAGSVASGARLRPS